MEIIRSPLWLLRGRMVRSSMRRVSKVLCRMHLRVSQDLLIVVIELTILIKHLIVASADDPQCVTPKSRKNETSFNPTHLPSATASPSTQGSGHSEDFEMGSPNWNRTPGSPVCEVFLANKEMLLIVRGNILMNFNYLQGFSSHTPQENFRPSSATSTKVNIIAIKPFLILY